VLIMNQPWNNGSLGSQQAPIYNQTSEPDRGINDGESAAKRRRLNYNDLGQERAGGSEGLMIQESDWLGNQGKLKTEAI